MDVSCDAACVQRRRLSIRLPSKAAAACRSRIDEPGGGRGKGACSRRMRPYPPVRQFDTDSLARARDKFSTIRSSEETFCKKNIHTQKQMILVRITLAILLCPSTLALARHAVLCANDLSLNILMRKKVQQ